MKNQITSALTATMGTVSGTLVGINVATITDQNLPAIVGPAVGLLAAHFVKAKADRRLKGFVAGAFLGVAVSTIPIASVRIIDFDQPSENVISPFGMELD